MKREGSQHTAANNCIKVTYRALIMYHKVARMHLDQLFEIFYSITKRKDIYTALGIELDLGLAPSHKISASFLAQT